MQEKRYFLAAEATPSGRGTGLGYCYRCQTVPAPAWWMQMAKRFGIHLGFCRSAKFADGHGLWLLRILLMNLPGYEI